MSTPSPDPPGIRISDADRERAAGLLNRALVEGRITVSELEERLAVVYGARYEVDLRPPLADLPGGATVLLSAGPSTPSGPPLVLRAGVSGLTRTGAWTVPARLRVQSTMGGVVLDFCAADNPHPVVEVELQLGVGSARLLLPDHATAEADALAVAVGDLRLRVPSRPRDGAPHFVVHGRCAVGSVTIRRRYRLVGRRF